MEWRALALNDVITEMLRAVPLPMYFSHYVFSKEFYTFWVACTMWALPPHVSFRIQMLTRRRYSIWAAMSGVWCMILPLWESRAEIGIIMRGMVGAKRTV